MTKAKRGRKPRKSKYDELIKIDASPEAVARSLFNGPPKKEWEFMKKKAED
ncbi:MAG: hypothetical protein OXC09_08640 [Truepera sp.]|nr:hypothetical protein [Truepera sp.]